MCHNSTCFVIIENVLLHTHAHNISSAPLEKFLLYRKSQVVFANKC